MASLSDHCPLCSAGDRDRAGALKHQAWCPHFLRGPDAGGDPAEWTGLPFSEWETGLVTIGGQRFTAKQPPA